MRPELESHPALRVAILVCVALLAMAGLLLGGALLSGQMNPEDIYSRVPRPVAAWLGEDQDVSARLQCDGVDERAPAAIEMLAARFGIRVTYQPVGAELGPLSRVDWYLARDEFVAWVAVGNDAVPGEADPKISGACPG